MQICKLLLKPFPRCFRYYYYWWNHWLRYW